MGDWRTLFALLCLGFVLLGVRKLEPRARLLCAISPLIYLSILIAVSLAHPMLITRVALGLLLPIYLLIARGLPRAPQALLLPGAAIALLISAVYLHLDIRGYREGYVREDWRSAARAIHEEPDCQGPLVYAGADGLGIRHQDPSLAPRLRYALWYPDIADWAGSSESPLDRRVNHPQPLAAEQLSALLAGQPGNAALAREMADAMMPAPP